jgi:ATPase subunit of ABC transporter with duplicated ATPase domains
MLFQGCSMQPVVAKRHRQLQPRAAAAVSLAPPPAKQQQLNVPRGETAGAVLTVNDLLLSAAADRDLMSDVQWRVMPGERWGLVGANGAGKSTLLKALAGIRQVGCEQAKL